MTYRLLKTDRALESMKRIVRFVAQNFDTDTALKKIDELEEEINRLAENPYMGRVPGDRVLRREGYRILTAKMDVIFYKVNDERSEVVICLVADQRQNYVRLLKERNEE